VPLSLGLGQDKERVIDKAFDCMDELLLGTQVFNRQPRHACIINNTIEVRE